MDSAQILYGVDNLFTSDIDSTGFVILGIAPSLKERISIISLSMNKVLIATTI